MMANDVTEFVWRLDDVAYGAAAAATELYHLSRRAMPLVIFWIR